MLRLFITQLFEISKTKMTHYRQNWQYSKNHHHYPDKGEFDNPIKNVEQQLLKYVVKSAEKGSNKSCIDAVDNFCGQHWMMNLGPEKSLILQEIFKDRKPSRLLELGGYCGYSSLVFSQLTKAQIHTVEITGHYANIAQQIQQHAGVKDRNHISIGTVSTLKKQIQEKGPYDVIFIDHAKGLYLSDFKLLQQYGVIGKGTLVIDDNIIYPGAKDYLQHFKNRNDYDSTLYHSYVQYSNIPDAVLVAEKL